MVSRDAYMLCLNHHTPTAGSNSLSLHDALPIYARDLRMLGEPERAFAHDRLQDERGARRVGELAPERSEEHTSELQSRLHLVCRLLLEKKKQEVHRLDHDTVIHGHLHLQCRHV